jgi:hypothetical protein
VAAKEGLFPLSRMYNVHPRYIARYNNIDFNKGLAIGQPINIPLTDTNFKQNVFEGVPVYYQSGKENLVAVTAKTKAEVSYLQQWNKISGTDAGGKKLIVGFLVTKELQGRVVRIEPARVIEENVSNVNKQEAAEKKPPVTEVKKDVAVQEENVSNVKKQEAAEKKPPVTEVKKDVAVQEENVSNVKKQEAAEKKLPVTEVKKDVAVQEENVSNVKKQEAAEKKPAVEEITDKSAGYFASHFKQQVKTIPATREQTVTSSIFKTTSGWQDAKYYMLINGVEPGTIIKITNPTNSKAVFAKVLYSMDKIRENQGVDIRISDAAAAALSVAETDKFILKVNY